MDKSLKVREDKWREREREMIKLRLYNLYLSNIIAEEL